MDQLQAFKFLAERWARPDRRDELQEMCDSLKEEMTWDEALIILWILRQDSARRTRELVSKCLKVLEQKTPDEKREFVSAVVYELPAAYHQGMSPPYPWLAEMQASSKRIKKRR